MTFEIFKKKATTILYTVVASNFGKNWSQKIGSEKVLVPKKLVLKKKVLKKIGPI